MFKKTYLIHDSVADLTDLVLIHYEVWDEDQIYRFSLESLSAYLESERAAKVDIKTIEDIQKLVSEMEKLNIKSILYET